MPGGVLPLHAAVRGHRLARWLFLRAPLSHGLPAALGLAVGRSDRAGAPLGAPLLRAPSALRHAGAGDRRLLLLQPQRHRLAFGGRRRRFRGELETLQLSTVARTPGRVGGAQPQGAASCPLGAANGLKFATERTLEFWF